MAEDAYITPSGEYVSILQESPVEMKITAVGNTMNSILFSIQNPEILSDAVTHFYRNSSSAGNIGIFAPTKERALCKAGKFIFITFFDSLSIISDMGSYFSSAG